MSQQHFRPAGAPLLVSMVIFIVIICNLLAWSLWDSTLIMDDGVQYLSTAANWLLGNGFATNALIYEPHFQNRLPAPQTVWPPGLPFIQALVASTGIELKSAALLINLVANILSALMAYLLLRRCGSTFYFAVISALIYFLTAHSWMYAAALLTEPVFTLLLLASVYCLPTEVEGHSTRWVLAGLLIAGTIFTRYSGVFAAAAFVVAFLFLIVFKRRSNTTTSLWSSFKGLALFCILPALAFVLLLFRTRQLTGTVERRTGTIESKTVFDTFFRFAEEASVLTGFRDGLFFRNDVDTWMFGVFVLLIIVAVAGSVFVLIKGGSSNTVKTHVAFRVTMAAVMIAHALAFCGYLVYASLSDTALNITSRYLYQVYPGLFVLLCALVAVVFERGRSLHLSMYRWAIGALVFLYLVVQVNLIPVVREFSTRGIDSRDLVNLQVSDGIRLADVVDSCVGGPNPQDNLNHTSLWSNDGVLLHLNAGVNTLSLPKTYATDSFDFKQWQADIESYQIRMFVFINQAQGSGGLYGKMLTEIKQWLKDNNYPVLSMQESKLKSGASVNIYLADSQCVDSLRR